MGPAIAKSVAIAVGIVLLVYMFATGKARLVEGGAGALHRLGAWWHRDRGGRDRIETIQLRSELRPAALPQPSQQSDPHLRLLRCPLRQTGHNHRCCFPRTLRKDGITGTFPTCTFQC